ncbi:MAG TPA: hypothetical protein VL333_06375 [Candidatus Saccharimonadales bacterium]|nr:hypothetical protein [Candidatus Saccharimonadales bacterium]
MDAALVREFLRTIPERPNDAGTVTRMRGYLEALGRPDVRYLVGAIRGGGAPSIARYARAVLVAAGATVALADDPLDEPLIAIAGTSVATIAYQLGALRPELGQPSRREVETLIAFVAHAEASRRVLLLLDPELDAQASVHGALPDVIAIGRASPDAVGAAIADAPERRPVILAPRDAAGIDAAMRRRALPYVLGGRDFTVTAAGPAMALSVGDERYSELALGAGDDAELAATGIVMALAIAALGVRMRPEWVELGARAAAAPE